MTNGASIEAPFAFPVVRCYCIAMALLLAVPFRLQPMLRLSKHCVIPVNGFVEQEPCTLLIGVDCRVMTGRAAKSIPLASRISMIGCTVEVTA